MPTLADLGLDESGNLLGVRNTLGNLGRPAPSAFRSRVTYYAPGPGDRMEGGFETSRPNPLTGKSIPATLDDVRLGRSPFVTVAGDPSRYGQRVNMGDLPYRSPIDNQMYTVPNVVGYVHDTGSAFKGRPDKLDVAVGDFRGWSPSAASRFVTADAGTRTVTPDASSGGWNTAVGPAAEGVGYVAPERVAQGASTNPAELAPAGGGFDLGRLLANFDFKPAKVAPAPEFSFGRSFQFAPIGRRRA